MRDRADAARGPSTPRPSAPPHVPAFTRPLSLGGQYACPKCGKLRFNTVPRSGDLFDVCQKRECDQPWWALVLPGAATVGVLFSTLTQPLGRHILHQLGRNPFADLDTPLLDLDLTRKRTFLFLTVHKHERHRLLYADHEAILATAGIRQPHHPIHPHHTDRYGHEGSGPALAPVGFLEAVLGN